MVGVGDGVKVIVGTGDGVSVSMTNRGEGNVSDGGLSAGADAQAVMKIKINRLTRCFME